MLFSLLRFLFPLTTSLQINTYPSTCSKGSTGSKNPYCPTGLKAVFLFAWLTAFIIDCTDGYKQVIHKHHGSRKREGVLAMGGQSKNSLPLDYGLALLAAAQATAQRLAPPSAPPSAIRLAWRRVPAATAPVERVKTNNFSPLSFVEGQTSKMGFRWITNFLP